MNHCIFGILTQFAECGSCANFKTTTGQKFLSSCKNVLKVAVQSWIY